MGIGTFGSRSAQLAGSAIHYVSGDAAALVDQFVGRHDGDDIVFEGGKFVIAGTDRAVDLYPSAGRPFRRSSTPSRPAGRCRPPSKGVRDTRYSAGD
jgi:hypothetical protein